MDFIYKTEEEVKTALQQIGWRRIIEAVEKTFVKEKDADCPPKVIRFLPNGNDFRLMYGQMDGYFGVKLISAQGANKEKTLSESGTYSLYDIETSKLLMFCMANELTAFRTAAATAVAIRHLATKRDYHMVGVIGCGKQAGYHIEAIRDVLDGDCDFWLYDKDDKEFALSSIHFHALPRLKRDILQYADIIVTLTPTTEPHIFAKDIDFDRDVLYCSIGGDNEKKIEIHQEVLFHMHVFCDSYEQVDHTGIMHRAKWIPRLTSLGDFIIDKKSIPKGAKLFISTGVALQDLAMGRMIYEADVLNGTKN